MGSSNSTPNDDSKSKSIYQRYQDKKRPVAIPEEDLVKYLGKTRSELNTWADSTPGVGKNQLAGKITLGPASGLGGSAAAEGYGGWGPGAEPSGPNRGMKFPPQKPTKTLEDDD